MKRYFKFEYGEDDRFTALIGGEFEAETTPNGWRVSYSDDGRTYSAESRGMLVDALAELIRVRLGTSEPLEIARAFRQKVCKEIDLEAEGLDRFVVYTPFTYDDGDHYVVVLKKEGSKWVLTDEGNTFMRISYRDVDMSSGTRADVVDQALATSGIQNRDGELRLQVPGKEFGDALFTFVQTLSRIDSTSLWT